MIKLVSNSPRRKELLKLLDIPFEVVSSDYKEQCSKTDPVEYAIELAISKAKSFKENDYNDIVIGCDTIVVLRNLILRKPKNFDEAVEMISLLNNETHLVITGVCLLHQNQVISFHEETKVFVDKMSQEEIIKYCSSSEPYDKAGGYGIQGLFSKYITSIEGCYYNVMGLPLNKLNNEIKKLGI